MMERICRRCVGKQEVFILKKKKLLKITAVFFAFMLCFTVLSRAADQMSVAVVATSRPENRMITHDVTATGKIVQNQEMAVTTEPAQRVKSIYVSEGDRVKKGDLLFEIDLTLLEEQILNQQQEMEKQQLTVGDAKSQKDVSAQQKASQQAQAAEQYALSAHSAGVRVSRAKAALEEAKKELKKFRKQHKNGTSQQDSSVEASLEQACEEKAQAYIQAQQELAQVQWKIENAVNTALQNAQAAGRTADLRENAAVLTGSAETEKEAELPKTEPGIRLETSSEGEGSGMPEDIIIEESEHVWNEPAGGTGTGAGGTGADAGGTGADAGDTGAGAGDTGADTGGIGPDTGNGGILSDGSSTVPDDGDIIIEEIEGENTVGTVPDQQELAQIGQSVRNSYAAELAAAQQKVETALVEKQKAEAALAQYQQERLEAGNAQNAQSEKQLIANVKAAQQAYEDAAIAANEAAVTSGRAVQQAGIPDAQNSSDRMNEITYEQMELQLSRLEKLREEKGQVRAPADGLITKVQIITGEKTTDTTAMLMADLEKGFCFVGELTKAQEEYIGTGDLVTLRGSSKKQVIEELPVESVLEEEDKEGLYRITVQIPAKSQVFELGAAATLSFSKKSEAYPVCVPLSALRLDEKNQTYVLVTQQYDSVLGTETRALRKSVTVLEKNEAYAALAEGSLTSQQEVIVSSAKAVDDGSRVRVQE